MSQAALPPQLATLFGDRLLTDPASLQHYGRDWTRLETPAPSAVVLPAHEDEVLALVELASKLGLRLIPSGGRTGLSGGAMATSGEIVVAMDRLRELVAFQPVDPAITVEAGMTVGALQQAAADRDLYYPVDWAAAGSAQVGGSIATNAGGIRVLRYGLTRDWVAGLTVITGAGERLELNHGLIKNATGVDLRHLLIGSEGTLGIITQATLRLTAPPPPQQVMLIAVATLADAAQLLPLLRRFVSLSAFEFFSHRALEHVTLAHALPAPFDRAHAFYVLAEYDQDEDAALAAFEAACDAALAVDGVLSQSDAQAANLWAYRERITESIAPRQPYKNDLAVRPHRVADFLAELDALVSEAYPDFELIWFGHLGDGNLHFNILPPKSLAQARFVRECERVNELVFDLVQRFAGSISAEHGLGRYKAPYAHFSRSRAELALTAAIKTAFDPNDILNPTGTRVT